MRRKIGLQSARRRNSDRAGRDSGANGQTDPRVASQWHSVFSSDLPRIRSPQMMDQGTNAQAGENKGTQGRPRTGRTFEGWGTGLGRGGLGRSSSAAFQAAAFCQRSSRRIFSALSMVARKSRSYPGICCRLKIWILSSSNRSSASSGSGAFDRAIEHRAERVEIAWKAPGALWFGIARRGRNPWSAPR